MRRQTPSSKIYLTVVWPYLTIKKRHQPRKKHFREMWRTFFFRFWGLFFNRPFLPLRPSQWPTKKGPIVTFSLTHIWHSFLRPHSTHKSKSSKRTIDFPHIGDNNVFRTPESSQEVAVGVLPGLVAVFSNVCNVLPWVLVLSTIPIGLNLNTDSAIKCTFTRWELRT